MMDKELQIAILMNDYCTRKEAEDHLKDGAVIYSEDEKQAFIDMCLSCGEDEEEAENDWNNLDKTVYNDVTYHIMYVL